MMRTLMVRMVMMMFVAYAALGTMSENARAGGGGGGSKKDATVKVTNKSETEIIAVVPGTGASFQDFLNNGGQFIQPGQTATFKTKAGAVVLTGVGYDDLGVQLPSPNQFTVNVSKGKTANVNVTYATGVVFSNP